MSAPPQVKLSPRGVARARSGHPWIYRVDVASAAGPGDEAVVVVDDRGRPLGSALWAEPPAPIALRMYARGGEHVRFDDALLAERIRRAAARRQEAGSAPPLCRVVHAEADQLPGLFVDRYGDAAVIQTATAAMDRREPAIARLLIDLLGVTKVIARDDGSIRDHEGLPRRKAILAGEGTTVRVREGSATLELDLLEDAKTGGFLDQRENHARAGEIAKGEALDAFSYHGGFALAMAAKAASVVALEADPRAVARLRRNAELSGFAHVEARAADAFVELRGFESAGRQFDVVVVDPPALAKRRAGIDTALRAYQELNLRALRITRRDGWLVTCSCSGKVTPALFGEMLVAAARDAKREVAVVERRSAGRDHPLLLGVPETDYLKCWFLRVL